MVKGTCSGWDCDCASMRGGRVSERWDLRLIKPEHKATERLEVPVLILILHVSFASDHRQRSQSSLLWNRSFIA